jgi:microcompartment protein CcmL/EutN
LPEAAIGLLELESLARGIVAADVVVKQAEVRLLLAEPVSPGKFILLFAGGVAEVEESFRAGQLLAGGLLIDSLYLPRAAEQLVRGLESHFIGAPDASALGIVETHTVSSCLLAADAALKRAQVVLTRLQLARGIGGKGWFIVAGEAHDVEAALEGAGRAIAPSLLVATEVIRRPHAEVLRYEPRLDFPFDRTR